MKKSLDYINISNQVTKDDGSNDGIWYFGNEINLKTDLIIGFSPTNYHCFIISGDHEFHARFSINPCKVQAARVDNIRAALFFRFKDIPKSELEKFQLFLLKMKNKRTPSCHVGLLQVLFLGLDLRLQKLDLEKSSPKSFLKSLWEHGLITNDGRKLSYDVYSSRDKTPDMIFSDIDKIEAKYSWVFWLSRIHFFFLKHFQPDLIVRHES
jgi:hypothetical protein